MIHQLSIPFSYFVENTVKFGAFFLKKRPKSNRAPKAKAPGSISPKKDRPLQKKGVYKRANEDGGSIGIVVDHDVGTFFIAEFKGGSPFRELI